ncbi:MAG TPA: serine hydrolase domain-containing protein [Steroidobacteraceae bacterium]|nr:serine hydrolase domain-containing protein [Steroidobacteraceae bacterium]
MRLLRSLGAACATALLVGVRFAAAAPVNELALSPEQHRALDTKIEHIRQHARVPGLAIGIVDDGVPVYARGFGVRDLVTRQPVTTDTRFHIASISKTFTVTAVMQLIEQGKLHLNDKLERWLPPFKGSSITLEELLTHTAGLDDWIDPEGATQDWQVAAYVARVAKHHRDYPPGKGWAYTDADFNLLGAVIEAASSETFPDYLANHVFNQAGLSRTTALLPPPDDDFAWPHIGEWRWRVRRAKTHPWDRVFIPSSGIESTVTDLLQWALVNLRRDPALLTPESYALMFKPRVETEWDDISMGLGWQLEKRGKEWLPRHPGGDPGFHTLLQLYPAHQRAIVILSNGETTPRAQIRELIEQVLRGDTN